MNAYLDIVKEVLNFGTWKKNRTGVRTLVKPCITFTHHMSQGFPLLTTKKMSFKVIAVELEGFIKGISDKRWFEERGARIWSDWCNPEQIPYELHEITQNDQEVFQPIDGPTKRKWQKENPDLGSIYGVMWRDFGIQYKPIPFIWTTLDKKINVDHNSLPNSILIGQTIDGKYGKYTVISYDKTDKNHVKKFIVKFHKTGYIKNNLDSTQIKSGNVFDPYYPNIAGVACLGEYKHYNHIYGKDIVEKLKLSWKSMIHRCYNPNNTSYHNYGAKNIYVSNRWLIFANFLDDVQHIEGWNNKLNDWKGYQLDKDIKGDGYYSENSCLWVSISDNANHTSQNYYFDAVDPSGYMYTNILGLQRFCKRHALKVKNVEASIANNTKTHNGWKFIRKKQYNAHPPKYDQLKTIVDTLKKNPDDRRMVCSAWNPVQISQMALPPCHYSWGLVHINGELNLYWTQRSCDLMLGVPFNIASYALLLRLLAKESNMKAGSITGLLADCHIYENHVEKAKEQLLRKPKILPGLNIPDYITLDDGLRKRFSIFDWTHKNYELFNYDPHPSIKMDVAI